MSHREKSGAQPVSETSEESSDASGIVDIPTSTDEPPESDVSEEPDVPEWQLSSGGRKVWAERQSEQSEQSSSSLERDYAQAVLPEAPRPPQRSSSPAPLEEHDLPKSKYPMRPPSPPPVNHLAFLDEIKTIRETLKSSRLESSATVKVVLLPVAQEIIMPFRVEVMFKHLKDYFSHLLSIPSDVLQITSSASDQYQEVPVEIVKSDFHKPFLGGFRHKVSGIEYHNAGTQTLPKKIPVKNTMFCRETQTVNERKKLLQTVNTTSTQMTKIGVYVPNMTDKLVTPGKYFTAAEYHAERLQAVLVLQTYYRRWHAKMVVEELRRQKRLRIEWELQEELRKKREKEEWMTMDYYRRHNPNAREDFELLYNALELWRQEELARIDRLFTGAERKAALCELLEKESQLIASIGKHRFIAGQENREAAIKAFLDKCSTPKVWKTGSGKTIEMDTQFTIRARELQSIYECILLKNISQDERLDVLLTLKHTVKEHECKLTQEILELIDREVDLMMRGVKSHNLEGLRKRITTLFLQYIKTPLFNPEVARYLKVPQDPLKFYKKIYFCQNCQLYLPSTEFSISSTSQRIYRCRHCSSLDNETRKRESFLKYKSLLQRLYFSEADYEDDSKIAYLMQLQDIQYLVENIWASQSALSAWDDLNDLVMVRWERSTQWSPWNCILLTKDEGIAHLKLSHIEEGYEPVFIHKIRHKHILAKNYFSQIPLLASFLQEDEEMDEIRKKHHPDTSLKIIEPKRA
ncbi:IQ motif and ubiquitin-like domain-containing protein isoform X2 [Tenrec ecaudatus]|uniref:IQ motif and ubiquitin-like domain-containing protein isoform X2 n=1 Tax=Tenrec ecaudatus TaxID=94439 RepID=UPI003F5A04B8